MLLNVLHAGARRTALRLTVAVALVVLAGLLPSRVSPAGQTIAAADHQLERPDDPPGVIVGPRSVSPRAIITFGDYTSIQVNTDENGNNVVGDAANEPSIAVDPTAPNRLAVGWRQFDTISSNFRQGGVSHSVDGGRNWSSIDVLEDGVFRSDPVLASAPDGTFYYLSARFVNGNDLVCDVWVSHDAGATWPEVYFADGGDKAWIVVDPNNNHLYQAWNTAGNTFFPAQFSRSVDGGANWDTPVEYDPTGNPPARPVFGILDTGPNGEVYVAGVENALPSNNFWFVRSTNAVNSMQTVNFDLIRTINMGGSMSIGGLPNPGGLLGQLNVAVDTSGGPYNGRIYLLGSIHSNGSDPANIHVTHSSDGGDTWGGLMRVNDDPIGQFNWQWFAAMDVAPNGRVDVVWNDTRNTGAPTMSQLFYCNSTDGGSTWSTNVPVSPAFDSTIGWPDQNKIGDYYDIKSDRVGADVIYAATFNGEQDVYYLRIGDYDCNDNGVGDATDIANHTSADCNNNGIPDECEIAAGVLADNDDNGIPDVCQTCAADLTGPGGTPDNTVDVNDLFLLLSNWNTNGPGADLAAPNNIIDVSDLFTLLAAWGDCP